MTSLCLIHIKDFQKYGKCLSVHHGIPQTLKRSLVWFDWMQLWQEPIVDYFYKPLIDGENLGKVFITQLPPCHNKKNINWSCIMFPIIYEESSWCLWKKCILWKTYVWISNFLHGKKLTFSAISPWKFWSNFTYIREIVTFLKNLISPFFSSFLSTSLLCQAERSDFQHQILSTFKEAGNKEKNKSTKTKAEATSKLSIFWKSCPCLVSYYSEATH